MKYRKILYLTIILSLFIFAGCTAKKVDNVDKTNKVDTINKEEGEKIKAKVEPVAENILQSLKDKDYESFSKDFDDDMKNIMTEELFKELYDTITPSIGKYQSKEFWMIEEDEENYTVFYKSKFDKERKDVIVKVVVSNKDEDAKVTGFFVDSPNLRK
ncbi:DUF3887 domain-containing protein [Clostridium sp. MSJ-11]|uniref:DUF3887 domain-containing protein n=1 Tax=Clostridium mobile TaxID=2841512 RepID=A0ABS6EKX9_9CLOT|nr:DUF3887 domain-containing protein [Clostridium mobile]MBU5485866.1 DUF3887 domain-containing protein [Clostridium mobile]